MKDFPELTRIQMVRLQGQVLIGAWIDLYCKIYHVELNTRKCVIHNIIVKRKLLTREH